MREIKRPQGYQYFKILKEHLNGDMSKIFNGELIYPRQIEIHLPSDHKKNCNFNCPYCQGAILEKPVVPYEEKALSLMYKLGEKIPYYIFGGAYSEPLSNPYFMAFLSTAKYHKANFGIHTNGSLLKLLEEEQGWLTELCRIATDKKDYLSVSLDAGFSSTHSLSKGLKRSYFYDIIEGLEMAIRIRGNKKMPAIRICYLLNDINSSPNEIENIVNIAKGLKVDSLRFSIPYEVYGKDFSLVRKYRDDIEVCKDEEYKKLLNGFVSKSIEEVPFIFYFSPENQDVKRMNFKQCIYCYYQITLGADGYVYRCSSTATPSFSMNRLGKITDNLEEFDKMILANLDPNWDPNICFKVGARCNRMGLLINNKWKDIKNEK